MKTMKAVLVAAFVGAMVGGAAKLVPAALEGRDGDPAGADHHHAPLVAEATWEAGTRPAPHFTLQDQDGHAVSLASLNGRVVLLTFLDSRCTDICQVEGPALGDVQEALSGSAPPLIVAVSVNPDDTAASARQAADNWGWQADHWHWLMGSPDQLAQVWGAYGVDVQLNSEGLLHTGVLYVIDDAGNQRAGYASPVDRERVARVVGSLVHPP